MKNKAMFIYMIIVVLLFVLLSFSLYIEDKRDAIHIQQTEDAGAEIFHVQLTAIAESTPYP